MRYLGTYLAKLKNQGAARVFHVIGLGSYTREKNVELVIRAIGCMPPPRPELVWVGNVADAGLVERSTALADAQGVALRPLTRIGDDELVGLLNHASAMVYAPRLEPFGLAPIEAAACGLPVVAVAEGGVRETVIDGVTGLLVGSDPAAISAGVTRLLSDPALARRLGENGQAIAREKWSADAASARLEEQLLGVVSHRRGLGHEAKATSTMRPV